MADFISLAGDHGYEQTRVAGSASLVVDASEGRWIVSNMGDELNRYPVIVEGGAGVTVEGGTIEGEVPFDIDWKQAYVNSAALFVRDSDDVLIRDWSISRAWDGIRIRGDLEDRFTIDGVRLSRIRDDAIENDHGLGGTIRNSLFDGVFVGLSTADDNTVDQTGRVVALEGVLMRMESSLYKGDVTHQSPFKVYGTSPKMAIHDTVIAIEDVDHAGQARLRVAWDKVVEASGSHFLNLSDDPLPKDYPMPPEGFAVLQGQEAREHWQDAVAAWSPNHPEPQTTPDDAREEDPRKEEGAHKEQATTDNADERPADEQPADPLDLRGSNGDDRLVGDGGDDILRGGRGDDLLRGGDGDDILHGGRGGDLLKGEDGDDILRGSKGNDTLEGGRGDDALLGGDGRDDLIGHEGDDVLRGQNGNDRLVGRLGADVMIGGGGDDQFRIARVEESTPDDPDTIRGGDRHAAFEGVGVRGGDRFDFRGIDADSTRGGNQAFEFGSKDVGGIVLVDSGRDTHVLGNTDGDRDAEFVLVIKDGAVSAADYGAVDFLL